MVVKGAITPVHATQLTVKLPVKPLGSWPIHVQCKATISDVSAGYADGGQ